MPCPHSQRSTFVLARNPVSFWRGCFCSPGSNADAAEKTNLVFILTDNQGAWTLGCYGNPDIRTPHIDRLAAEGIRFTRALSSNPVCSPTRATFLTGLIPSQHGVHSYLGGERPDAQMGPEAYCTIREFASLPKILSEAGYVCGLSGKWHLGANLTPQEGFSSWITMPHGHTTEFYDVPVHRKRPGAEGAQVPDRPVDRTRRAVHRTEQGPAVLPVPGVQRPVLRWAGLLLNPARNRHAEYYADKELLSFPRDAMHPWQFNNKEFLNNPLAIRRVAAEVSGVDDGVGEILATLRRLQLDERTLVVFAADQGWMGGQNGLWGMGDHTRPVGAHELMMQIPLIFRHSGKIPSGQTSDLLVSNYDFLPTVLSYLGLKDKTPSQSPGRDFSSVLLGKPIPWDNVTFYEMENTRAIRTDGWKYVARQPGRALRVVRHASRPARAFQLVRSAHRRRQAARTGRAAGRLFQPPRRPAVRRLERRPIQSRDDWAARAANRWRN